MKYLLDTHSVSNDLLRVAHGKIELYLIREVLDESSTLREKEQSNRLGVKILETSSVTLQHLKLVLEHQVNNPKLISLYTGKGTADVLMLAHILAELIPTSLFPPEPWTIVTQDGPLIEVAKVYDIPCISSRDLVSELTK